MSTEREFFSLRSCDDGAAILEPFVANLAAREVGSSTSTSASSNDAAPPTIFQIGAASMSAPSPSESFNHALDSSSSTLTAKPGSSSSTFIGTIAPEIELTAEQRRARDAVVLPYQHQVRDRPSDNIVLTLFSFYSVTFIC